MTAEASTESVLRLMADKPREQTAFMSLIAGLRTVGLEADLLGSPERQEGLYGHAPPIPIDAEVAINGVAGFVDHTVVPAPQEDPRRVATQDVVAHELIGRLQDLAAEAPGGGLWVSISASPWLGAKKKDRERLYDRVVEMARKAVERRKPFVDLKKLPQKPFPVPTIGFCEAPEDHRVTIAFDDLTLGWSGRFGSDGQWSCTIGEMRNSVGRAIEGKLKKQLARVRAVEADKPIGLLLDSRPMHGAKGKPEPVFDLPPLVLRHMLFEIAEDWPGVLSKAWLISPQGLSAVYGDPDAFDW
ncbi:hypothetical protein GCM10010218_60460 [Streptomyces mashuensis]|uniref:Uncharacterized protein n=1 Tax=Streptomyces mashuensis TaxID=33904 RepID=A0A919BAE1_9ACTN|nr:hypothetical protein [Streptomyces mashuensis]GHF71032.1 hypothetical protein GCM10010218_60460 [Streptomyces mashuensis]